MKPFKPESRMVFKSVLKFFGGISKDDSHLLVQHIAKQLCAKPERVIEKEDDQANQAYNQTYCVSLYKGYIHPISYFDLFKCL